MKKNAWICHFFKPFGLLLLTSLLLCCNKCTASQVLEFTLEPSDTIVPEGSSVLLQCAGQTNKKLSHVRDGKISPNIRWRGPDGQDIGIDTFRVQLTNGSLYISSVNENRGLTGNYQCLLSVDGVGTIVSRTARLSIVAQPEINQESNEIYLDLGQTAYIRCMTSSQKPLMNINDKSYKMHWYKDDMPLLLDNTRMVILPTGSLEIDELTLQDRGTYQCNASYDNYSRVSSKMNLNIRSPSGQPESFAPPSFAVVPSTQTIREGDQVILECAANGNPRPKISWLQNGIDIDFNNLDSRFRMIGTGSLQITNTEDGDSGDYQCRASNSIESLDASATLNVHIPPKFQQAPTDKLANEKDELELSCSIFGKPPPAIQWMKNGDLITPNDYMQITGGHNLKILGLISSDAGMFQCVGINPAGSVQASAFLQVVPIGHKKHKLKKVQATPTVKTSTTAVTSTKKPNKFDLKSMTTTKNNKQLANDFSKQALDSLLSRNKNSQFSASKFQDSQDYLERLNDNQHSDFDEDDDEEYDDEEDEGTIHKIQPGTDPKILLHALENARNSDTDDVSHFSNSHPNSPVTRKPQQAEDSKPLSTLLPGTPRAVQAPIIKPRFVTLNWLEPKENPDEVVSYTVYYKMNAAEARERKAKTNSRDEQEVNVQGLLPGRTYHFRVVANSNHGPGNSSEILEIATLSEENMAGPPENFRGAAFSHDEIFLQWDVPRETNGAVSKYRVFFAEGDNGEDQSADTNSNEFMLTQLRAYCEYTIYVVAFNQNGMGNPSQEILVKTFSNTPTEPPSNISVEASSSTSVSIRWEPPPQEHRNGPLTGYKIKYKKAKNAVQTQTTPSNIRFYELANLDKLSAYQIKIAAMTVNGTGPFSDWVNVETYENDLDESQVPGTPGWIRTKAMADSIIVTWGPPAQAEIKVRAYIIGWGKGIPDEATQELDENSRAYEIRDLEPNSEYVIALRARNNVGDGEPKYDNTRTREDFVNEPSTPLEVPVGLRAIPLSGSTSIVVYWTDTTLGKSQHVTDNRYYTVRYSTSGSTRYRFHNTTLLNCMIVDLKPNTQYEFEVKVVKGRRESSWSMSVLNTTMSASPSSPPRDLKVSILDDKSPLSVHLSWSPPKTASSPITNYVILYTTDSEKRDHEWAYENVPVDKTSVIINQLAPHTTYFFKVRTKHGKTLGSFSAMASVRTGAPAIATESSDSSSVLLTTELFYALIGGMILLVLIIIAVVSMIFCKKKPQETPEHKKSYQKNPASVIKPPDLWIHHDQMELKNLDKTTTLLHPHQTTTPGCSDGASSSGAMTLPRSVGHDFETDSQFPSHITNSLDKRTYVPGYMTNSMSSSASDRPQYPRTQYNIQRAPHISTMDPSLSQQNITGSIIHSPENPYAYDVVPANYSNPNMAYAAGISMEMAKQRGHPLKSFSIPAPPSNTPLIPNHKPVPSITIRPQTNSSPYKNKSGTTTPLSTQNRLQTGQLVPHSFDEVQMLRPSTSTEELNQEMANLEGLMKDLSAITASEFEC